MKYINKRLVVVINRLCVSVTGGLSTSTTNIREGASLGFVDRIHQNEIFGVPIYRTIYEQAGAYMFYILKNHIFMDGNKRTGLAVAVTFLQWNGIHFNPFEEDAAYDFVIDVAAGANDPEAVIPKVAAWLESQSTDNSSQENG